ncbi:hypothetical protein HYPSUDRAFT_197206 [Hypholoma sublateritium FD-334 SS-4]|uniref:Uncharacterized protein n=1 Tax=Hypholoma sublateritium (strain FD-334 SS-4) TaxID=945553 RepID=A0A0D2LKN4_HYPSF|nr:hypothetical protein HYPSUDRAFT_197206 [Hypholoma sublateritium FD-334 SS-4]
MPALPYSKDPTSTDAHARHSALQRRKLQIKTYPLHASNELDDGAVCAMQSHTLGCRRFHSAMVYNRASRSERIRRQASVSAGPGVVFLRVLHTWMRPNSGAVPAPRRRARRQVPPAGARGPCAGKDRRESDGIPGTQRIRGRHIETPPGAPARRGWDSGT